MSPDNYYCNMPAAKASGNKDENNNSSSSSGRKSSAAASRQGGQEQQQQQSLKCPRCDSQNTKFCYYNNYSLTQPRHFCKTCRRYWTKGGALRNVPIGGGCRKNKKMMKSSSSSSRLSLGGDSKDSSCSTSSDIGGMKFFHGLTPAMDFQLGTGLISFPRVLHHHQHQSYNQFPSFADISAPNISSTTSGFATLDPSSSTAPLLGFNFPFNNGVGGVQEMGNNNNIASSIESLSSINQDLHWKLQQQRLAAMFCGSEMKDNNNNNNNVVPASSSSFGLDHHSHNHNHEKPQTILFHNLEETTKDHHQEEELYSRKEGETEWFFGDSYNNNNNNGASAAAAVTTSSTPMISNSNGSWMNNGMQSWSNLNNQYTSLP